MKPRMRVTVQPREDIQVINDCLSMLRNDGWADCANGLNDGAAFETLRVLQNIDAELMPTDGPLDFTLTGNVMQTLLNGTSDIILGEYYITLERMDAGVLFSNAMSTGESAMLHRNDRADADLGINTRILTEQIPSKIIWIVLVFYLVAMVMFVLTHPRRNKSACQVAWEYFREMLPGSNTNSFATYGRQRPSFLFVVKAASILAIFYQLLYSALLAQSLMVRQGIDMEELPYEVLRDLTSQQTVMFVSRAPVYQKVLFSDDQFSRLIRQSSIGGKPTIGSSEQSIIADVKANGHVWMAARSQIVQRVSKFTDDECKQLRVTRWPMFDLGWSAIPLSPNITAVKREYITSLAAMRTTFDKDPADSVKFSDVCREQLFSHGDTQMKYYAIDLSTISGIFWIWFLAMLMSIVCVFIECTCGAQRCYGVREVLPDNQNDVIDVWTFDLRNDRQCDWIEQFFQQVQEELYKLRDK